jgi:hypothetical protein
VARDLSENGFKVKGMAHQRPREQELGKNPLHNAAMNQGDSGDTSGY